MTFTAQRVKFSRDPKKLKANYPFADMKANPGTGFIIPAEQEQQLFAHCRVMASNYNKKHGTHIICNKLPDGSLRVLNQKTDVPADNTLELLTRSVQAIEAKKADQQAPSKEQFISWFSENCKPGMSITLGQEYVHRFYEFEKWIADMYGFDSEITYNPPSLKVSRLKGE
jgi:hypothetical protein